MKTKSLNLWNDKDRKIAKIYLDYFLKDFTSYSDLPAILRSDKSNMDSFLSLCTEKCIELDASEIVKPDEYGPMLLILENLKETGYCYISFTKFSFYPNAFDVLMEKIKKFSFSEYENNFIMDADGKHYFMIRVKF